MPAGVYVTEKGKAKMRSAKGLISSHEKTESYLESGRYVFVIHE